MTSPPVLQRLYYTHGPFVEEALKQRLSLYRQRLRLVLIVSFDSVAHVIIFFTVALLLRRFDADNRVTNLVLAVAATLIFTSLGGSIIPALTEHWRSESNALPSATQRRFKVQKSSHRPPLNAEFLFYLFMTPNDSHSIVGDLEERYELLFEKFGQRRANFWYWSETIRSLGPIVWWAFKRAVNSSLSTAALVNLWRKISS